MSVGRADPPAMGERRARWGYGYQDKVATQRTLHALRQDLREAAAQFEGARLADLEAGRVDDFVLIWRDCVEGNSIKWSADCAPFNWGELVGSNGLLKELAAGFATLRNHWVGRTIKVRLHSNRGASAETHHAQLISSISVAEFIAKHWALGPDSAQSTGVSEVWSKIATHVGLSGSEFATFVACCDLSLGQPEPPGARSNSVDSRHYRNQFDSLHKAIATWLTNHPKSDLIDRDYLLRAIGYQIGRSGLVQRFPDPDIPYERNQSAAERLKDMIDSTPGGYLAVVGPAGVGKSTLVQDVLTGFGNPFFVPYYAFLPHTDGNRDRAEALTFFQDIVERLDRFDSARMSLGVADLAQGRGELRKCMSRANQRYVLRGEKTVLLVDGLDHVMREAGLQAPVLNELPHPNEIPDGFIVILSGQPQAFLPSAIPVGVAASVEVNTRRVEVSGLSRSQIHALVSRVNKATNGSERDELHEACLGNPLILTYILAIFERSVDTTVEEAIEFAGNYVGHVDQYYKERLSLHLQDIQTRRVLGLLCRAAPTIDLAWLAKWPEKDLIEDIYSRVLAAFVRIEDGRVTFIHDSLISFLKMETRSRLLGSDPSADERNFFSTLADRALGRGCIDPVGRACVGYLMKAGRHSDVLAQLSSDWLRSAISAFLPYAHMHPMVLSGLSAACSTNDWGNVLRLTLLGYELNQRTNRVEAGELAEALLALDEPDLALAQIRSGGRLLVDDNVALEFAAKLWWFGNERNRTEFTTVARKVYQQAKPIWLIYTTEPIDLDRQHVEQKALAAWVEVAPLFEPTEIIAKEILRLTFTSRDEKSGPESTAVNIRFLYRALTTALEAGRDLRECQVFSNEIEARASPTWRFVTLFRLAESFPLAITPAAIRDGYSAAETDHDLDLAYAWFMFRNGHADEALEVARRLKHIRFEAVGSQHSWRFSDVTYTVRLRWLQEVMKVPEGPIPEATEEKEAHARLEHTARQLGLLRAGVMKGQVPSDLENLFRSLLLFHNRPVQFSVVGRHDSYILSVSKKAIFDQISRLAQEAGLGAITQLRDVFLKLIGGATSSQFGPSHRRFFAQFFYRQGVFSREQAIELCLSSTADAMDDDPRERQSACLEIATFLHRTGDSDGSQRWIKRASEVAAGAGSHKDYHMAHVADWLVRSIVRIEPAELLVLDRFSRAVEIAGGQGGTDAAATELRLLVRLSPARARRLALEWVDRDVLSVSDLLEAMIEGAAQAQANSELLCAVYCELHSLISPSDTSSAALAVLASFPPEQRRDTASRLMARVRTNALPSHRADVARALQDAIRKEGLEPVCLTQALNAGRDDSSRRSALYTTISGEIETMDQIAERLSDPAHPEMWNPNEGGNPEFDWWSAIKKARLKDVEHLEKLVARFPPAEYREVELLALKAELFWEAGDRTLARALIDQALARAKDGSWHRWLDGAQKVTVFRALKRIDHIEGIHRAREEFSRDLGAGKVSFFYVLPDIPKIFELLAVDWPAAQALDAVSDYIEQVLQANKQVSSYDAFTKPASSWSASQALCMFVADLLACPVVDVGVAARRALAIYFSEGGDGFGWLFNEEHNWDPVQLERLLVALHVGLSRRSAGIEGLRSSVQALNRSESLAVRSIAKRICKQQNWSWEDITNASARRVILLTRDPDERHEEGVVGNDVTAAWELHQLIFRQLERAGLDRHELRSEFEHVYRGVERDYPWADKERLDRWLDRLHVRFWLKPRAILGREAAMRVFGARALSGQVPPGAEVLYDQLSPIYDQRLELLLPQECPEEFAALEWDIVGGGRNEWLQGMNASEWSNYPVSIKGLSLIGERTLFTRPEWEWPREERYRGLILGKAPERSDLDSDYELTYEMYAEGRGQPDHQLIVLNSERQLAGPAYRWAAINANFASELGWHLSNDTPFKWLDSEGRAMVESQYWKNAWIWLEPPRFESLGEGWIVLASSNAIDAIRTVAPTADCHLWVERHSHGSQPYRGKWHLTHPL
jgi:hypothetical protein